MSLRRRPRSAALMRLGYRVAYRGLQAWAFVRRPRVQGTMVAVLDGPRVLLVRHAYGDRRRWELPGGWVRSGEEPAAAARRELLEEVGLDVPLRHVAAIEGRWDHKRERLSAFAGDWPGGRRTYDPVEIAEVAWFARDALPARCSAGTRAVLDRLPGA